MESWTSNCSNKRKRKQFDSFDYNDNKKQRIDTSGNEEDPKPNLTFFDQFQYNYQKSKKLGRKNRITTKPYLNCYQGPKNKPTKKYKINNETKNKTNKKIINESDRIYNLEIAINKLINENKENKNTEQKLAQRVTTLENTVFKKHNIKTKQLYSDDNNKANDECYRCGEYDKKKELMQKFGNKCNRCGSRRHCVRDCKQTGANNADGLDQIDDKLDK
eukprot:374921_1